MQVTQHLLEQRKLVEKLGYQLIYEDSKLAPWCIADKLGNIICRSYTYFNAISQLKKRLRFSSLSIKTHSSSNERVMNASDDNLKSLCLQIVKDLGFQLIYEDSELAPWCIADKSGNILWRNFTYSKAVWRLKSRIEDGVLAPLD